jgi:sugar phosphate isomerase/epimerase
MQATFKKDHRDSFKAGIVHFMAYPQAASKPGGVLESILDIVQDEFFEAIEITTIKDPAERQQVKSVLETSGVTVGFGAQPILLGNKADLNSLDEAKRQTALGLMKQAIDEAYEMHAQRFAVLSGPDPGDAQRDEALDKLVTSLTEICAYARSKGTMQVALETFDRTIDKKCLIGPNRLAVEIAKQVRKVDPTFGLMVDLSHFPLQHESTAEALKTTEGFVVHAHMGNCYMKDKANPAYGDLHPRFGYPGGENGPKELADYLKQLHEFGYLGDGRREIVAFEVKPLANESSKALVGQSKRTLLEAWSALR